MEVPLEKYLQWPPFYTLQPNSDVKAQQLSIWAAVFVEYARKNKLYIASVEDFGPIGNNSEIGRSINQSLYEEVFRAMVKSKQVVMHGDTMFMFWKSPQAWGELIHQWAVDAGRIGSVETLEGLVCGDETVGQQFYGIPVAYIHVILKALQKTHKCELFEIGDSLAVKFFN